MAPLIVLILVFVAAFGLSWLTCAITMRIGVVDAPDGERKLQAAPVPRLGGIGIMAALAIVIVVVAIVHTIRPDWLTGDFLPGAVPAVFVALGAAACFTLIGAGDDVFDMPAKLKLALLLVVCIASPLLGVAAPVLTTPFGDVTALPLLLAGSALWLLVFTNAANFMDGSNGLSMGCLAIMFAGLAASLALTGHGTPPPGLIAVIGAIGGFLVHNLAGKLYAGDAGAFGVSGLFATLALISGLPVWTVATLALPFLVDIILTLIDRTRRKQSLFNAHRDHAYQALLKSSWAHLDVAVMWWGLSAACAVAAAIGAVGGGALPFLLFWLMTAALLPGWFLARREAQNV
ncbi:glycosyltransferase family 4 protein [Henriciella litoralis]|uniref:glycosyltransferase family 4 protein n=1 Tax=Henriciella litoralis TaxID=568102 RepID=UPI000A022CF6|nr:hypothetical protein [Henriciella litoralis]